MPKVCSFREFNKLDFLLLAYPLVLFACYIIFNDLKEVQSNTSLKALLFFAVISY